jgi:hypothetical protein
MQPAAECPKVGGMRTSRQIMELQPSLAWKWALLPTLCKDAFSVFRFELVPQQVFARRQIVPADFLVRSVAGSLQTGETS